MTAASWPARSSASTAAWPRSNYEMTLNTDSGLDGEYVASPEQRVRKQVEDYESSGGVAGARRGGRPRVILSPVRARSGQGRHNPALRTFARRRPLAAAPQ